MNKDRTRERTIEQAEADAQAMVDELERLVEQLRLARAETSAGAGTGSDGGSGTGVSTRSTPTPAASTPSRPRSQPHSQPQPDIPPGAPFPAIPEARIRTFPGVGTPFHAVPGARSRLGRKTPANPSAQRPANQPTNELASPTAHVPEASTEPPSGFAHPHRPARTPHQPHPLAARLSWVEARTQRIRLAPALGLAAVALVGIVGAATVTAVRNASGPDGGSGMEPIPYARTASGGPGSAGGAHQPLGALPPRAGADAAPGPRNSRPGPSASGSVSESAAGQPSDDRDAAQEGPRPDPPRPPRTAPSGAVSSGLNDQMLAQALRQAEEAEAKELQALAQSFAPTGPVPRLPPYGGQRRDR